MQTKIKRNHRAMRLLLFYGLNHLLCLLARPYRGNDCRSAAGRPPPVCKTGSGTVRRSSRRGVAAGYLYQCGERSSAGSRKSHLRAVGCKWHPRDSKPEKKILENSISPQCMMTKWNYRYFEKHVYLNSFILHICNKYFLFTLV